MLLILLLQRLLADAEKYESFCAIVQKQQAYLHSFAGFNYVIRINSEGVQISTVSASIAWKNTFKKQNGKSYNLQLNKNYFALQRLQTPGQARQLSTKATILVKCK